MTWIVTTSARYSSLLDAAGRLGDGVRVVGVGEVPGADVRIEVPQGVPVEALAARVATAVSAQSGEHVLLPDLPAERVLAGAIAARLGAPLVRATKVCPTGALVARYGGLSLETVTTDGVLVALMEGGEEVEGDPTHATETTRAAGATDAAEPPTHATQVTDATELPQHPPAREIALDDEPSPAASPDLGAAERIVTAGRGFRTADDLALARSLAGALGAELAGTRPLTEAAGWLPRASCVGLSGHKVAPALYVAVGVSGQLHHLAGCSDADLLVAINSDPDAPIFAHADYGIVGDLYRVLPALTAALRDGL